MNILSPNAVMEILPAPLQSAQDTLVTVVSQTPLQVAADGALVILTVVMIFVFTFVAINMVRLVRQGRELSRAMQGFRRDLAPVVDRGRVVAENVEHVSKLIRKDADRLQESLDALGQRLTAATEEMEDRVQEFNALVQIVQGEAEDLFLDAAATVKGVRTGARELTAGGRRPPAPPPADDDPTA
jgi:predicted PurR-regulated permease PerM